MEDICPEARCVGLIHQVVKTGDRVNDTDPSPDPIVSVEACLDKCYGHLMVCSSTDADTSHSLLSCFSFPWHPYYVLFSVFIFCSWVFSVLFKNFILLHYHLSSIFLVVSSHSSIHTPTRRLPNAWSQQLPLVAL